MKNTPLNTASDISETITVYADNAKYSESRVLVNESGEFIEIIRSTTSLSTSEFMDFIAEIQQWTSEFLGVYIPDPNEVLELDI